MSFSGDSYVGDWDAPPGLALGNGYGDGYGNGDGDGGWSFDGNAGPDDYFNWDDWVTGILPNDNSIVDNSVIDNSVTSNSISGNSLNPAIGTSATGNTFIDNSLIDHSFIDNPVTGNSIPFNTRTLNPAIGTSATGNWTPGNSVTGTSATGDLVPGNWVQGWNSATGNYIIGNSVVASAVVGNSATSNSIAGNSVTGNWVVGNSATSNSIAGNSVTGNWVVGNSVTDNFHLATANQFVANPVAGPSVTGNPATANAQHVSLMAAQQQAYAQRIAAAQAQLQAATQQQTASALRAAQRKRRATATAKAQAAAQLAAGQVPAAPLSTSSGAPSSSRAPYPFTGVPSTLNHQPMNNAVTGNVVTGNSASITPTPVPAPVPAPIPSRPLLPHEIFPFMKLPQELQLMIYRYVWHTDPETAPSGQPSYQQRLQFYSSPRHLHAQLRGLFKLGAISPEIRSVAYAEYFGRTQLYLRYDDFFRWNYSDSWHGSEQLTASMNLLWQDATLSPLLEKYVQHVACHIGPVHNSKLCETARAALKWLQDCKNVKTLEIVVAMRSSHVRPKDVRDLTHRRGRFANEMPYSIFKFFRLFKWSINRLDVLRKKGSLDKVVFSVEPFVNESTRAAERGTIDLEAMLERSEWFRKFKRETVKHLLCPVPKKRKLDAKSKKKTEERSFYKIEQHLGHVNPKWHRSYQI